MGTAGTKQTIKDFFSREILHLTSVESL